MPGHPFQLLIVQPGKKRGMAKQVHVRYRGAHSTVLVCGFGIGSGAGNAPNNSETSDAKYQQANELGGDQGAFHHGFLTVNVQA
jgi:hypothetical protein